MALEQIEESLYHIEPGPIDVHTHPRVFDAVTEDSFVPANDNREGKAGLRIYTDVALQSGLVAMVMMPNESLRRYNPERPEQTELVPYPLSNLDRILATEALIAHEAVIPVGIHFGVDPEEIYPDEARMLLDHEALDRHFSQIGGEVVGLKLYGDETTGGYNIRPSHIPTVTRIWNQYHPHKPVTLHLEDQHVGEVLSAINRLHNGKDTPLHIAHVSSQEELEAIIEAKNAGMNVTSEVTVHHLFLDGSARGELGGYGYVKPSLKAQADIAFLWANLKYIDIIASDCAPHRRSDKEAGVPGVTTHTVMLPLLFGAVADGKLTHKQLYQKLCINPRQRFNLPLDDGSFIEYNTNTADRIAAWRRSTLEDRSYGYNPFRMLERQSSFHMVGWLAAAQAGASTLQTPRPSYTHLIRSGGKQ